MLDYVVVKMKFSVKPTDSSKAGINLQCYPSLGEAAGPVQPSTNHLLDAGLSQETV